MNEPSLHSVWQVEDSGLEAEGTWAPHPARLRLSHSGEVTAFSQNLGNLYFSTEQPCGYIADILKPGKANEQHLIHH